MRKLFGLFAALAFAAQFSQAQVVFRDAFESDASFGLYEINELTSVEQGETHFFEIVDLESEGVGNSPNAAAGDSNGMLVFVNFNGGFAEVLNFYTAESYTGNIKISLDVYMYVNVGEGGSTEAFGLGMFHEGGKAIGWENLIYGPGTDYPNFDSDGYYFTMTGEGGSSSVDYMFTKGYPNGSPGLAHLVAGSPSLDCFGEWADGDELFPSRTVGEGADAKEFIYCLAKGVPELSDDPSFSDFWSGIMPKVNDNQGWGVPANQWITVTMEYVNGAITTSINGTQVHSYTDPDATYTAGKVMFWYEDAFSSQGIGHSGYIDNFVVEQLATDVESWSVF